MTELFYVAGGALGGALLTFGWMSLALRRDDQEYARQRHPSSQRPEDDDLPDWLNG